MPDHASLARVAPPLARALHERHAHTAFHCHRTQDLALALGRRLQLSGDELQLLSLAADLHDIGKIGIADDLLLKPGRLSPDEYETMKSHAQRGHDILVAGAGEAGRRLARIVLHHHERVDGSGYPHRLQGDEIPLLSQIIALADSYDAMAEQRPYHAPRSHAEILRILFEEEASRHADDLRERFAAVADDSPHRARA